MIRLAILEKEMQPNITRSMEVLILKTFLVSLATSLVARAGADAAVAARFSAAPT